MEKYFYFIIRDGQHVLYDSEGRKDEDSSGRCIEGAFGHKIRIGDLGFHDKIEVTYLLKLCENEEQVKEMVNQTV